MQKLEFQLSGKVRAAVDEARCHVQEMCSSLSVCAIQYDHYGSDIIKSSGLRADPLMQLAFQVRLHLVHNHTAYTPRSQAFPVTCTL